MIRRSTVLLGLGLLLIGLAAAWAATASSGGDTVPPTTASPTTVPPTTASPTTAAATAEATTGSSTVAPTRYSDLPVVVVAELPTEALDTLDLIAAGGPFPFDRDDTVFQNREEILPDHPRGHYREYTVITPGENDRGARRIVAGADGARYYTDDHYASFREVVFREVVVWEDESGEVVEP